MKKIINTPDGFVCMGYHTLYPNNSVDTPACFLSGLPLYECLHFVMERQAKVQYSFGDPDGEIALVKEMQSYVSNDAKAHIDEAIADNPRQYLFGNIATFKFIMLALQHCNPNISRWLTQEETESVYKAYLYCNDLWTSDQESGIQPLVVSHNLPGMYLMADVPIVEFKSYKDFRPQMYKAGRLFDFMSKTSPYDSYLDMLLRKRGVEVWRDYIAIIFSFYTCTLDKSIVQVDETNVVPRAFFDRLCVNVDECNDIWDTQNMLYLRNHPLLKLKEGFYMVLNPNLLVDKIYQGLKFDLFDAMLEGGAVNKKGKLLTDFGVFSSMLGDDFSESEVFYDVVHKAFDGIADKLISGAEMKKAGVQAESDFYVRIGEKVFLFEYKDVTVSDDVKYSYDFERTIEGIYSRIAKDDGKVRKGVGQLLYSINGIVNNNSLQALDPDVANVQEYYPIVVTTDRTFSALAIEYFIIDKFAELIKKWNIPSFVRIPMVLDLDTMFIMSKRVSDGLISFPDIVNQYLNLNDMHVASFETFYTDTYRDYKQMNEDDIKFLFSGLLDV